MDEDAAPEALEPAGSTPEGELTGKPYSSNSVAQTNSWMALHTGSGNREAVTLIGSSKLMSSVSMQRVNNGEWLPHSP